MISPLTILEHRGIDINNYIKAVQDAKALGWYKPNQFREAIIELVGDAIDMSHLKDDKSVKYIYYYLVQNFVKQRDIGPIIIKNIIEKSLKDTANIISRIYGGDLSYVLFLEENGGGNVNGDGTPVIPTRGRKGQKKEKAAELYKQNNDKCSRKEMIALFMKELDMSKPGATTYFYNLVKESQT